MPSQRRKSLWKCTGQRAASLAVLTAFLLGAAGCEPSTDPAGGLPALIELNPASVQAGSGAQTIELIGSRFNANSQVRVNGSDRLTTFVSSTRLDVLLASADVATPRSLSLRVHNSATLESAPLALQVGTPGLTQWSWTSALVPGGTWDVSFAPDGSVLAGGYFTSRLTRLAAVSGVVVDTVSSAMWPYDVAVHGASQRAFTAGLDAGEIDVINLTTFEVADTFAQAQRPIRIMTNAAGTTLYTTTLEDFKLYAMNASTGATIDTALALGGIGNGLAMVPGQDRLWVTTTNGTLRIVNTATWSIVTTVPMGGIPQDVVISADGERAYVANESGWIGTYNAATGVRIDSIPMTSPFGLALSPSQPHLWVAAASAGRVFVVNLNTGFTIGDLAVGGTPRTIVLDATGRAYIANEAGRVDIATVVP